MAKQEPCHILYDPCTKEPLLDIKTLEKRVRDIKNQAQKERDFPEFPTEAGPHRLDLLLFMLKRDIPPDETILNYKKGENKNFGTSLFESYWDIAIALGLVDKFKVTKDRYMYDGKVESLTKLKSFMKDSRFIAYKDTFTKYLNNTESSKVQATNARGASDITVVYHRGFNEVIVTDKCSYTEPIDATVAQATPLFYLISSKYYNKEKSSDKYDVERIHLASKKLRESNGNKVTVKIPILAKDKTALDGNLQRALNRFVADEIDKPVYGLTDLLAVLNDLYKNIRARFPNKVDITEKSIAAYLDMNSEDPVTQTLNFRFHQIMAIDKITDAMNAIKATSFTKENNKFLVGILPRGGKTYVAGGIVHKYQPNRVLVILGAKTETISQFTDELFNKFQNFTEYEVINLLDKTKNLEKGKKYIIISSIELLVKESARDEEKRKVMQQLMGSSEFRADLIIYDEAHLKGTRGKGRAALGKIEKIDISEDDDEKLATVEEEAIESISNIPIIFFTGTYRKPRDRFKIPDARTFIWTYEDIQRGKSLKSDFSFFTERFGSYADKALRTLISLGNSVEDIEGDYQKFPELFLLTAHISKATTEVFEPSVLSLPDLLAAGGIEKSQKPTEWTKAFPFPDKVDILLDYMSPKGLNKKGSLDTSAIDRIDVLAQCSNDRLRGISSAKDISNHLHSQLWFLPKKSGSKLSDRMKAMSSAILQHKWLGKNFNVICVYTNIKNEPQNKEVVTFPSKGKVVFQPFWCRGDNEKDKDTKSKGLKACIQNFEEESRQEKRGLIILAQDKLKLGISLGCVDIVVLLDDNKDADERIQKMYRALTESTNKKGAYIVDMNYMRCVNAIIEYQLARDKKQRKDLSPDAQKEFLRTVFSDIYAFDADRLLVESEKGTGIRELQYQELAKTYTELDKYDSPDIREVGDRLNDELRSIVEMLDLDEDDLVDMKLTKRQKDALERRIALRRAEGLKKAKGMKVQVGKEQPPAEPNPQEPDDEEDYVTSKEKFSEIYQTMYKYGVFTSDKKDLHEYFSELKKRTESNTRVLIYNLLVQRDIIEDNGKTDIQKSDKILHYIEKIEKKITEDGRGLYKTMAEKVNSYECNDASILEYIIQHLAPKDKERHKFGEVFTPLTLVDEMLSKLPKEVWSNPDLKWLDPANGIGNFPLKALIGQKEGEHKYPGLREGLKDKIPDEKKRCKHIIENMLYMIEINPKNNAIARKEVFKRCCPEATPNIEQIDSKEGFLSDKPLKFGSKTIDKFDIIMGNPPYNRGAVRVAMVTNKTRKERQDLGITENAEPGFWFKFVEKALSEGLLKPNGFLLFVHPITWFKPDRAGAHDTLLSKQIRFIKIYKNDGSAQRLFEGKGKISIAYYLLENKAVTTKTQFEYGDYEDKKEEVLLSSKSIILLNYNSIYNKVVTKAALFGDSEGLKHKTIKDCDDKGTNKLITILEEKGVIKYVNSSKAHPDQDHPKLIVGGTYTPIVLYDKKGEFGLYKKGQRHYFMGDGLERINDYFKTKLSTLLLKNIKYEQDFIKPSYFPDVRSIDIKTINDDTLAEYFGFTAAERKEISQMPDPIHPKPDNIIHISCAELNKEPVEGSNNGTRKCKPPKELHPKTNKCVAKCKDDKVRMAPTYKCVKPKQGGRRTRKMRHT